MQYLVSVIDDRTGSGTPDERAEIDAFDERLVADGHRVFAGGLEAPDLDVAIELAGEGSGRCNRKPEVRPFLAG